MIFIRHLSPFAQRILLLNSAFLIIVGILAFVVISSDKERTRESGIAVPVEIYDGAEATSTPVSVSIPSIGVEASIVKVGRTSSGNMGVPEKYEDVGWYRHGPFPGQVGNAVIAGHLDDGRGNPAVFGNLARTKIGDIVYVTSDSGEKLAFSVREIRLVDYFNPPLEEIFGKADGMHLNIITCDGTWLPEQKTYDKRLVLFTDRVELAKEGDL